MRRIIVIGGGFAGLWSAASAARRRNELGLSPADLDITLVNRDAFHGIRVRNYEADLSNTRIPLGRVLDPIDVRHVVGNVTTVDLKARKVGFIADGERKVLPYDGMIVAAGSEIVKPPIPGLNEHAFSVDTFDEAARLERHLAKLSRAPLAGGHATVLVVGAGLTGVEIACELPARLRTILPRGVAPRVILADHASHLGSTMGSAAIPVIGKALNALGVQSRTGVRITAIDSTGATLDSGERIAAGTVIWAAGMRASSLTALFPVERDRFGRLPVDPYLRVHGLDNVFAAGDAANCLIDGVHASVMSCQHARPMGRFAGHNAVSDLFGAAMLPLRIDWYVTVLDLGSWGALYTHGWDRRVVATGMQAKQTKQTINCVRIYPPLTGKAQDVFDAASPIVQAPPERYA